MPDHGATNGNEKRARRFRDRAHDLSHRHLRVIGGEDQRRGFLANERVAGHLPTRAGRTHTDRQVSPGEFFANRFGPLLNVADEIWTGRRMQETVLGEHAAEGLCQRVRGLGHLQGEERGSSAVKEHQIEAFTAMLADGALFGGAG